MLKPMEIPAVINDGQLAKNIIVQITAIEDYLLASIRKERVNGRRSCSVSDPLETLRERKNSLARATRLIDPDVEEIMFLDNFGTTQTVINKLKKHHEETEALLRHLIEDAV